MKKLLSVILLFHNLFKNNFSFNNLLYDPHLNFNEILNFNFDLMIYKFLFTSKHIIIAFIKFPVWILIFMIYFYLFFNKSLKQNFLTKIYLFGFFNLAIIYFIFLTTTSNFEWLVKVTLDRMVFQTTGFYLVILSIFLIKLSNINSKNI